MPISKKSLLLLILPLFLNISCLNTKSEAGASGAKKSIEVSSGNVVLKIQGQKDETKHLSKGEKYTFSVALSEVVVVNILTADENDAEIIVKGYGRDRTFPLKAADRSGLDLVFQSK